MDVFGRLCLVCSQKGKRFRFAPVPKTFFSPPSLHLLIGRLPCDWHYPSALEHWELVAGTQTRQLTEGNGQPSSQAQLHDWIMKSGARLGTWPLSLVRTPVTPLFPCPFFVHRTPPYNVSFIYTSFISDLFILIFHLWPASTRLWLWLIVMMLFSSHALQYLARSWWSLVTRSN